MGPSKSKNPICTDHIDREIQRERERERERGVLGGRGGFFFEPMADVLDVAPKDGGRLFDITPQQ